MPHGSNPTWLRQVLNDRSAGPTIYKWTIEDALHSKMPGTCQAAAFGSNAAAAETTSTISNNNNRSRIYILGIGNLGRLFASSLARLPDRPPITLVVHRKSLLDHWHARPGIILHPSSPLGRGAHGNARTDPLVDFDVEMWCEEPPPWPRVAREITPIIEGVPSHIHHIVIATKAQNSLPQADWLRRYLGPESTVMFAQNGMNKLWPPHGAAYNRARYCCRQQGRKNPEHPLWLACVVTHGVLSLGPFESVHASPAGVVVGPVDTDYALRSSQDVSTSYLAKQLLAAPLLNARHAQMPELWVLQLEKLVVNSIINPLTTILRCKNGDLFSGVESNNIVLRIMDKLLDEASNVIQRLIRYDDNSRKILEDASSSSSSNASHVLFERLGVSNLRRMLYDVGEMVKDNTSSMLQDARLGRMTEIREFNGWIVETANYLRGLGDDSNRDIDVTYHATLIDLVESRASLTRDQLGERLPPG